MPTAPNHEHRHKTVSASSAIRTAMRRPSSMSPRAARSSHSDGTTGSNVPKRGFTAVPPLAIEYFNRQHSGISTSSTAYPSNKKETTPRSPEKDDSEGSISSGGGSNSTCDLVQPHPVSMMLASTPRKGSSARQTTSTNRRQSAIADGEEKLASTARSMSGSEIKSQISKRKGLENALSSPQTARAPSIQSEDTISSSVVSSIPVSAFADVTSRRAVRAAHLFIPSKKRCMSAATTRVNHEMEATLNVMESKGLMSEGNIYEELARKRREDEEQKKRERLELLQRHMDTAPVESSGAISPEASGNYAKHNKGYQHAVPSHSAGGAFSARSTTFLTAMSDKHGGKGHFAPNPPLARHNHHKPTKPGSTGPMATSDLTSMISTTWLDSALKNESRDDEEDEEVDEDLLAACKYADQKQILKLEKKLGYGRKFFVGHHEAVQRLDAKLNLYRMNSSNQTLLEERVKLVKKERFERYLSVKDTRLKLVLEELERAKEEYLKENGVPAPFLYLANMKAQILQDIHRKEEEERRARNTVDGKSYESRLVAHTERYKQVLQEKKEHTLDVIARHDQFVAAAEEERQLHAQAEKAGQWHLLIQFAMSQKVFNNRRILISVFRRMESFYRTMRSFYFRWYFRAAAVLRETRIRGARIKVFSALLLTRLWGGIAVRRQAVSCIRKFLRDTHESGRIVVALHSYHLKLAKCQKVVKGFLSYRYARLNLLILQWDEVEKRLVAVEAARERQEANRKRQQEEQQQLFQRSRPKKADAGKGGKGPKLGRLQKEQHAIRELLEADPFVTEKNLVPFSVKLREISALWRVKRRTFFRKTVPEMQAVAKLAYENKLAQYEAAKERHDREKVLAQEALANPTKTKKLHTVLPAPQPPTKPPPPSSFPLFFDKDTMENLVANTMSDFREQVNDIKHQAANKAVVGGLGEAQYHAIREELMSEVFGECNALRRKFATQGRKWGGGANPGTFVLSVAALATFHKESRKVRKAREGAEILASTSVVFDGSQEMVDANDQEISYKLGASAQKSLHQLSARFGKPASDSGSPESQALLTASRNLDTVAGSFLLFPPSPSPAPSLNPSAPTPKVKKFKLDSSRKGPQHKQPRIIVVENDEEEEDRRIEAEVDGLLMGKSSSPRKPRQPSPRIPSARHHR